jgi:HlyD family secretion protein
MANTGACIVTIAGRIRNWILPGLAGLGLGVAIETSNSSTPKAVEKAAVREISRMPFANYVAGSGIIEAYGRNVDVATPVAGVIEAVFVSPGQAVARGNPLFRLEALDLKADLLSKQAAIATSQARLAEAEAALADYQTQLSIVASVRDQRAVSAEEKSKRRASVALGKAKLVTARAELESTRADVAAVEASLERRTIVSPIDGTVLQVNAREGQFAQSSGDAGLVVVGRTDKLAVRLDIDENDAWRVKTGQPGWGYVRGNRELTVDLTFDHIEPYVRPKQSLNGTARERTDTRVLQVIFSFEASKLPVYVGQQIEAFMGAGPASESQLPLPMSKPPIKDERALF